MLPVKDFAIVISSQGMKGCVHEINGRHCIGDQRILGLEPNLFPSHPQNVPRFWPLDHWRELAGSGVSLVVSEGIYSQIPCQSSWSNAAFPLGMVLHLAGMRRFLGLTPMSRLWYALPGGVVAAAAVFYYGYDLEAWRSLILSIAISVPHFVMAFLILRHPVRPSSMFYSVIASLLALAGVMILGKGIWSLSEPQFHIFLHSPVQFIFFVSVIVLQLGETLAFMMLNSERVESELVESEAELRTAVASLQDSLAGQKLVEEFLRESEERYRTFFDTSRDCVFMTSLDGQFIDFNDVALEIFGYAPGDREELLQTNVSNVYANPEEREAHASLVAKQGFSKEYPVDLLKKDGTIIHTLITTIARRDPNGTVIGFQGYCPRHHRPESHGRSPARK